MGSIISTIVTICYSLLYRNSWIGFNGPKFLYSVISVIENRLPGNTKKWTLAHSWTARARLVHPWAEHTTYYMIRHIFLHDISVQTKELIQIKELQKYIFYVIVYNVLVSFKT